MLMVRLIQKRVWIMTALAVGMMAMAIFAFNPIDDVYANEHKQTGKFGELWNAIFGLDTRISEVEEQLGTQNHIIRFDGGRLHDVQITNEWFSHNERCPDFNLCSTMSGVDGTITEFAYKIHRANTHDIPITAKLWLIPNGYLGPNNEETLVVASCDLLSDSGDTIECIATDLDIRVGKLDLVSVSDIADNESRISVGLKHAYVVVETTP
jgi:hypothetical protein